MITNQKNSTSNPYTYYLIVHCASSPPPVRLKLAYRYEGRKECKVVRSHSPHFRNDHSQHRVCNKPQRFASIEFVRGLKIQVPYLEIRSQPTCRSRY